MKATLPICLIFFFFISSLSSQDKKGANPIDNNPGESAGTTRAVVIGISDYQNPAIPDLRFADKDAEVLAHFLSSNAGGNIPADQIKLLTNEQATFANIVGHLDWLVEVSRPGDKAFIYFSGHGDVESKIARQPGFLLAYDSPPKVYMLGAYPLYYLQSVVETLSENNGTQTIVISDACRAGKLAGSDIGGTQATAANLAKQYANEIKILSCQPDEYSLEGEQWGGGRGVFSYHLVEGLMGLADKNENLQINLLELENYLESIVPEETAPQTQIPLTVGSKSTLLSHVNPDMLAELKDRKAKQLPTFAAIESKGFEEELLGRVDTNIQIMYDAFLAALSEKRFLDASEGKASADELYRQLITEESLAPVHRIMTRQFSTALQDDAQQAINEYLLANPYELKKRWWGDSTYLNYPRYLQRAAELLGEKHYIYNYLKAKQFYFEGLNLRLKGNEHEDPHLLYNQNKENMGITNEALKYYEQAVEKLKQGVAMEDRAPFLYNELGLLHSRLFKDEQAFEYFEQAIKYSPDWGLPYINYCFALYYSGDYEKALGYGEKAVELLPEYPQVYSFAAWMYANNWQWRDKDDIPRKGFDLKDDYGLEDVFNLETPEQMEKRWGRSAELLQKAIEMDPEYVSAYLTLGHIYWATGKNLKAEECFQKVIELEPDNSGAYNGWALSTGGRYGRAKTEAAFLKCLEINPDFVPWLHNICFFYKHTWEPDKAIVYCEKGIEVDSLIPVLYGNLGHIYYLYKNQPEKSEEYQIKAIALYPPWPGQYTYLAWYYFHWANRPDDAEWMLSKAIEKKEDFVYANEMLAILYLQTGQDQKLLSLTKRLHSLAEVNPNLHYLLAHVYQGLGQEKMAGEELLLGLEKGLPEDYCFLEWDGFFKQSTYGVPLDELEQRLLKRLENKENEAEEIFQVLGYIYLQQGHLEKARQYVEKLLDLDSSPDKYYLMALIAAEEHKMEETVQWLEKYLEAKYAKSSDANDLEKIVLNDHLDGIRSNSHFKELIQKYFPFITDDHPIFKAEKTAPIYSPGSCIMLAEFHEEHGDATEAERLYLKALELQPDHQKAKEQLEAIRQRMQGQK